MSPVATDKILLAYRMGVFVMAFIAYRSAAKRYGWGLPGLLYALVCVEVTRWP